MEHSLRVLVRIDTKTSSACIEVRGCLVPENCPDLQEILRHTSTLGAHVVVNLTRAAHLDAAALDDLLLLASQLPPVPLEDGFTTASVRLPSRLPACPPPRIRRDTAPLGNDRAFEMAFVEGDPAALKPLPPFRQPG